MACDQEETSRHKCLIYDGDPSEQLPVVVPLLQDGLRENWRCMYLGSPSSVEMMTSALDRRGVDLEREQRRGSLLLSSDRGHLVGGDFDPDAMIDGLVAGIDEAVKDGFVGLCATGDMRWELGEDHNFERLLEYEARLEQVFRERPLRGICQYHRDLLPARAIADALVTHRSAYVGELLNRDNLFYIPPELLLESGGHTQHGEWMYQQIVRILAAERSRDQALAIARQSEAEQRRLVEELARLNRDLEERVAHRTAELAIANRHLESFAHSIAHDLRAPLRAMRSFTENVVVEAGHDLPAHHLRDLHRVVSASERMSDLIDALLDLARLRREGIAKKDIDLSQIAAQVTDELRSRHPERSVEVTIESGLRANADARLVRALFDNLVGNAWKFTSKRETASINIGVNRAGSELIFFVRDNGAGFDPAQADALFVPFRRLHGSEFPGTGVGLANVQSIVERHRGRIWAEGAVDAGATIYFTLPDH